MKFASVVFVIATLGISGCVKVKKGSAKAGAKANTAAEAPAEPAAPPAAYAGVWINKASAFLTMKLEGEAFEKITYNTDKREEIFTGSRGTLSVEGDMMTFLKQENMSSKKWYKSQDVETKHKFVLEGNELTIIHDKNGDGVFDTANGDASVVWVKE